MRLLSATVFALLVSVASAQSSTATSASRISSSSPTSLTIVPGTSTYSYQGCYNETTGDAVTGKARALSGGSMDASDTMDVQKCSRFCGKYQYAGLEYGRECWCSVSLNTLSQKLPDSRCDIGCMGNDTQICGGSLSISLYSRIPGAESLATRLLAQSGLQAGASVLVLLALCAAYIV